MRAHPLNLEQPDRRARSHRRARVSFGSTLRGAPVLAAESAGPYGASDEPNWRALAWEKHAHSLELAAKRVSYVDIGRGGEHPLLLLHGVGGCWQNWLQNIPRLALERRVVALDLPGFGDSAPPRDRVTISLYAEVVDQICARLGLGRIVVVGNSLGGMVACELAAAFAERVARLVLLAPTGVSGASLSRATAVGLQLAAIQPRRLASIASAVGRNGAVDPLGLIVHEPGLLAGELARAALAPGVGKPGFTRVATDRATDPGLASWFSGRLRSIRCPALTIWGASDRISPVADAAAFTGLLAKSQAVIVNETGHMPMLERPRPMNALMLAGG